MDKSVYEKLRQAIVSGEIPTGLPLVEATLAEQYGVSRTPVREALQHLSNDGLLIRVGRGLEVVHPTPEEILETYEVRILLEEAVAGWAAVRRTELDLNRLIRAQEDMQACTDDEDPLEKVRTNRVFHEQLWLASHNTTIIDLLNRINAYLNRDAQTTLHFPGRWEKVLKEHDELIEAVTDRNEQEARRIASTHLASARQVRMRLYDPVEVARHRL